MTIDLPYDSMLTLPDARGLRLACVKGALWITQEGDHSDTVLEAGRTFEISRGGKTIVVAVRDARLAIVGKQKAPRHRGFLTMPGAS
jgi:hypothetical protein